MKDIFPIIIALVGLASLFAPGMDKVTRAVICVAAMAGATVSFLHRRGDDGQSTITVDGIKKITFMHTQRPRSDRPATNLEATEAFDQALDLFENKNYKAAAPLYARSFELGNNYWPAKVNEGFCYQALGDVERALLIYADVIERCKEPRYRRQAYGNSGDIIMAKAKLSDGTKSEALRMLAYEKFAAAYVVEETFNSLYNLWEAASITGQADKAQELLRKLEVHPQYAEFLKQVEID